MNKSTASIKSPSASTPVFWNPFNLLMGTKNNSPWKRNNRHHVNMSKAAWKIRAHKRSRWEMAKLSRRANRG